MPTDLDNSSTASGEASVSSSGNQTAPPKPTTKKKRNLPGMPGSSKRKFPKFVFYADVHNLCLIW